MYVITKTLPFKVVQIAIPKNFFFLNIAMGNICLKH